MGKLSFPRDLRLWDRNYTKSLVKIVVAGHETVEDGEWLKVTRSKCHERVELFSSTQYRVGAQDLTELQICRRDVFSVDIDKVETSEQHAAGKRRLKLHAKTSTAVESGEGWWKKGGLREEMLTAELSVMRALAPYHSFETCNVTKTTLRKLCSKLYIRCCETDGSDVLRARLVPTWRKARAWSKTMETKITALMDSTGVPPPDMIRHVQRHEWCCQCKLPFRNKFVKIESVVGEHKQEGVKHVKRQCGETDVDAIQFRHFNAKVDRHVAEWEGEDRVNSQAGATSPAKSKRKLKTTPGGGGGGKSESSHTRKKPKRVATQASSDRKSRPRPGTEDQDEHLPAAAKRSRTHCRDGKLAQFQ